MTFAVKFVTLILFSFLVNKFDGQGNVLNLSKQAQLRYPRPPIKAQPEIKVSTYNTMSYYYFKVFNFLFRKLIQILTKIKKSQIEIKVNAQPYQEKLKQI